MLIAKTYDVVTAESAEQGDFAECGYVYREEEIGFKALVLELIDGEYTDPSCWPLPWDFEKGGYVPWVTCKETTDDPDHDGWVRYSLHLVDKGNPRMRRYWLKAVRTALRAYGYNA